MTTSCELSKVRNTTATETTREIHLPDRPRRLLVRAPTRWRSDRSRERPIDVVRCHLREAILGTLALLSKPLTSFGVASFSPLVKRVEKRALPIVRSRRKKLNSEEGRGWITCWG